MLRETESKERDIFRRKKNSTDSKIYPHMLTHKTNSNTSTWTEDPSWRERESRIKAGKTKHLSSRHLKRLSLFRERPLFFTPSNLQSIIIPLSSRQIEPWRQAKKQRLKNLRARHYSMTYEKTVRRCFSV